MPRLPVLLAHRARFQMVHRVRVHIKLLVSPETVVCLHVAEFNHHKLEFIWYKILSKHH